MTSILFHVEQHPPIALLLASGWVEFLFGPDMPGWAIFLFIFLFLGLLTFVLLVLALIYRTFKGSWDFFRWLHISRDKMLPCTNCGYDLRHKPDHCPECGQRIWFKDRRKTHPPVPPSSAATNLNPSSEGLVPPDNPNSSTQ